MLGRTCLQLPGTDRRGTVPPLPLTPTPSPAGQEDRPAKHTVRLQRVRLASRGHLGDTRGTLGGARDGASSHSRLRPSWPLALASVSALVLPTALLERPRSPQPHREGAAPAHVPLSPRQPWPTACGPDAESLMPRLWGEGRRRGAPGRAAVSWALRPSSEQGRPHMDMGAWRGLSLQAGQCAGMVGVPVSPATGHPLPPHPPPPPPPPRSVATAGRHQGPQAGGSQSFT